MAVQGCPAEWSYTSSKRSPDPFNDIDLDVVVTLPSGKEEKVPAFWAGRSTWRVRYAAPETGKCRLRSNCTDQSNKDLNGLVSDLEVVPYTGANPLYRPGSIKVAKDQRHFEQSDGTPFFWLGDTWWMGLCARLSWPDNFQTLTADRNRKGFTIVQIVAGLYPDIEPMTRAVQMKLASHGNRITRRLIRRISIWRTFAFSTLPITVWPLA